MSSHKFEEGILRRRKLDIDNLSTYLLKQAALEKSSFFSIRERKCVDDAFSLFMSKLSSLPIEPERIEQTKISRLLKLLVMSLRICGSIRLRNLKALTLKQYLTLLED